MASSAGDSPANTVNPARLSSIFRNRFSNTSLLSLSSVRTLLPQYSAVDTLEQSTSPHSHVSTDNRESLSRNSIPHIPSSSGSPINSPPRYSLVHPRHSLLLTRRGSTATRFEIEGDPQAHEFRYSYPIRPKKPWATLHLHTRDGVPGNSVSLPNQPRVPRFWSCDPITGTLQLDLDSPQNIQQISITLNGRIILSSHSEGSLQFLCYEFTLWEKSMGDPLRSDNADPKRTQKEKFDGRLGSGQYTFPFSFPFPTDVDPLTKAAVNINSDSRPHTADTTLSRIEPPSPPLYDRGQKLSEKSRRTRARRSNSANEGPTASTRTSLGSRPPLNFASSMPQTFMEKDINPNIAYDISVRIVHGIFKASSKIKTNITYIPASEPLPVSQRRREAYEAGGLLPNPLDDPKGWLALPTSRVHGVVKINEDLLPTSVDCTLYIAQPLSYTRGSVIPCFITISSDGFEVEHITERPAVRLLRRVHHPTADYQQMGPLQPPFSGAPGGPGWVHVTIPSSDLKLVTHEVGHAKWWIPSKDIVQGPNVRHFEGEVHLSPDLQPSCDFQLFRVEYAIELLSFETANFKPDIHPPSPGNLKLRQGDNVIASSPVQITTLYREGEPVPTTYSEPPKTYKMRSVTSNKDVIFEEAK